MLGHVQLACCLVAGSAAAFGFGYSYRGLGWIIVPFALAVLFGLICDASKQRAALSGYLFGAGLFGVGLNWTHVSLYVHGGLPLAGALAIALCFAAFLAIFPAAACALGRWRMSARVPTWIALLRLAAAWTLLEHIRSWLFTGFGWLALGYSQVPTSPLTGFIPIIGGFGVTFLTAIIAALVAQALYFSKDWRAAAVPQALVLLLLLSGLGLRRIDHTAIVGSPVPVSILQGAIPQHRLWLKENLSRIPEIYYALASRAQGKLIVTPETAFPFAWHEFPPEQQQQFIDLLVKKEAALVLGSFDRPSQSATARNVAIVVQPGLQINYAKRHLTPYGEYLPFAVVLEPILQRQQIPFSQLSPGSGDGLVKLPFATLGMSICYESLFPELFNAPAAEIFVNITNDAWFADTWMPSQHLQIAATRALEHGRWLIRASNPGPSAVIKPNGRVSRWIAPGIRKTINTQVERRTGTTWYARHGDTPVILVTFVMLLGSSLRRRRGK